MSAPDFEPLEDLPPARKRITAVLLTNGWQRVDIEEMLADFTHELAEEIRAERGTTSLESGHHFFSGMDYAASLIDPYHAGPVRPDAEPTT